MYAWRKKRAVPIWTACWDQHRQMSVATHQHGVWKFWLKSDLMVDSWFSPLNTINWCNLSIQIPVIFRSHMFFLGSTWAELMIWRLFGHRIFQTLSKTVVGLLPGKWGLWWCLWWPLGKGTNKTRKVDNWNQISTELKVPIFGDEVLLPPLRMMNLVAQFVIAILQCRNAICSGMCTSYCKKGCVEYKHADKSYIHQLVLYTMCVYIYIYMHLNH